MKPKVYITSFFKIKELPEGVEPLSAAVYQPRGYTLPKVAWTDIRRGGKWTRPREFLYAADPAVAYWDAMIELYKSRLNDAIDWRIEVEMNGWDVALCCWCPYDRSAKRQIEEFGSFICHTGPLAAFIEEYLDFEIVLDKDREIMYNRIGG